MGLATWVMLIGFAVLCLYALLGLWDIARDLVTRSWPSCVRRLVGLVDWDLREYEAPTVDSLGFPHTMDSWIIERYFDKVFRNPLQVTVFYSPNQPSKSVLLPGLRYYHLIKLFPATALLGFALWFVWAMP